MDALKHMLPATPRFRRLIIAGFLAWAGVIPVIAEILPKQKLLEAQTFWDNRDWGWYHANIPFFECPDAELMTTYYYRWELVTKHLTYGSPASGYSFTEFIDRPFWSGTYGAISCPAGHQLYEVRWLRDPRYARDYARYWHRTPGAQPRNYSTWLADATWAVHMVHPHTAFTTDLLPDLIRNYEGWEKRHFVPEIGLFWQTGHDDGMEYNINSRQTKDIVRGAPGFRPTLNSYLWADALAIAQIAALSGDAATADRFRAKAAGLKLQLQKRLWDADRQFFFHLSRDREEDKDGNVVAPLTLTYRSGKYAGSPHGREEIGFVPWQFNLPDPGYEAAWRFLMDPNYFAAERGPTTVEQQDPLFVLQKTCCWWSGHSWPYATAQTLTALANVLHNYKSSPVSRADYLQLLRTYSLSHRKEGRPYLAEALHPKTGSFEGHDSYNHSEHYFHSSFNDLIITGLIGLRPRPDDILEIAPLAPPDWDYFALDEVPYRGHRLSIFWDKTGQRYGRGPGLHVLIDDVAVASLNQLGKILARIDARPEENRQERMNFAVNNEGDYFPRLTASIVGTPLSRANDGNYWYHLHPPNRWTCEGSTNARDWISVDLGAPREINALHLFFLDDGEKVAAPASYEIERWNGTNWLTIPDQKRVPAEPEGHRANRVTFPPVRTDKFRVSFTHARAGKAGLTELEVWGDAVRPYTVPPPPPGNLAYNAGKAEWPRATASFSDRYGGQPHLAIDGKTNYRPTPLNRWTSYGSPDTNDWLEIDFGTEKKFEHVDLYIYDDRGGVRAPASYTVEYWDGQQWREPTGLVRSPLQPTGNTVNTVTFEPVQGSKLRVVFTHRGKARSGVTELEVR